jgi:predicted phosphodiesterase
MPAKRIHREEYLYLPALTHDAVIIAWGAFFFKVKEEDGREEWEKVDDEGLPKHAAGRKQCIGELSEPYAPRATVTIVESGGEAEHQVEVEAANHAVAHGLKPDTEYTYRVVVHENDGQEREWAAGSLRDWDLLGEKGLMRERGGKYENRFRTFPAPETQVANLTFAVIGDFGRGVKKTSNPPHCQRQVAEALRAAFERHDIRLLLATGDIIYAKNFLGIPLGGSSGDEDDDWFYTYFQPYRYLLNRIPVFLCIGNHDDDDDEKSGDRTQIYDNLYLRAQFREMGLARDSSFEPGLFYRFSYGSDIEFICLDTSKGEGGKLHFELPQHHDFIEHAFATTAPPRWRIPFSHHPSCCAGPQHKDLKELREFFRLRGKDAGVRVTFSGHEHNFQYSISDGIAHFLTGGGGKYRERAPKNFDRAMTQVWGGNDEGHFLLVEINGEEMKVTPFGHLANGQLRHLKVNHVAGQQQTPPFIV